MNATLKESQQQLASAKNELERCARRPEGQVEATDVKYSSFVEQANDAIIITDTAGNILEANHKAEALLSCQRVHLAGRSHLDFVVPEQRLIMKEQFQQLLDTGARTSDGIRLRRLDNTVVPVEYSASVVHQGEVRVALFIFRDVTERLQLQEQLLQSQRMEAIAHFAGGIAHDLNNVLTAMLGYTNMLICDRAADIALVEDLKLIRHAGEHVASLSAQLLVLSRRQIITPLLLDMNTLVSNTEKMLRGMIGEEVILGVELSPDRCNIKADAGQIEQVIKNLGLNARDAMPEGGRLEIRTNTVWLDDRQAQERAEAHAGPYVELTVSDTGTGIDPKIRSKIFEPFFTTKPHGKGAGLGLAIVYGIIKQVGGHISVASEVGRGTTFRVLLPRVQV